MDDSGGLRWVNVEQAPKWGRPTGRMAGSGRAPSIRWTAACWDPGAAQSSNRPTTNCTRRHRTKLLGPASVAVAMGGHSVHQHWSQPMWAAPTGNANGNMNHTRCGTRSKPCPQVRWLARRLTHSSGRVVNRCGRGDVEQSTDLIPPAGRRVLRPSAARSPSPGDRGHRRPGRCQ
jgi:hypothetical protein